MATKTNLELKHFCTNFQIIRDVLKKIGAKKDATKKQKDYFFHLSAHKTGTQSRLKLRIENHNQTLVYYQRPDFSDNKSTTANVILYTVNDKQLLPFLKEALGVQAVVEKDREIWRKDNVVFHLDQVKTVGKIFEIELQKKRRITKNDERVFQQYQKRLRPHIGKVIRGSNIDLVLKVGRKS